MGDAHRDRDVRARTLDRDHEDLTAAWTRIEEQIRAEGSRSAREIAGARAHLCGGALGQCAVDRVSAQDVARWLSSERARALAPKTRRKILALGRKIFDRLVLDETIETNPIRSLPRDMWPRNRVRDPQRSALEVLATEDVVRVLRAAESDPPWAALIGMAVMAGLRVGEASGAQWGDIVTRAPLPELRVSRAWSSKDRSMVPTKADSIRHVPIHPVLGAALARARDWHVRVFRRPPRPVDLISPWISREHRPVPYRERTALTRWHALTDRLGMHRSRLHGLRHTFVSRLVDAGAPEMVVLSLTHVITARNDAPRAYVHYSWPRLCSAVSAWEIEL
jgi:integrase